MSNSFKKNPICGIAGGSDKEGKRHANRALRRKSKVALGLNKESLPELREVSDVWSMRKDGKTYVGGKIRK